ncbi:MAG: type II toxin-antitoxin system PemK/MazF family toxin [Streptococcaceae bacterium]|nr:type II toxin-antitoxin system PemK/MazF family toxin [Streptococcaceae bacterium]
MSYIPEKQDIIYINFNPSLGKEIQKRRPAVVVSSHKYSEMTGFVAVFPVTHGSEKLRKQGMLIEVQSRKVDGFVNPFQLHTFDFRAREAEKVGFMKTAAFFRLVQLYHYIFEE